jgi:hypothetical protein
MVLPRKLTTAAMLLKPGLEVDAYERNGTKGKIKPWCFTCEIPYIFGG